MRSVSKEGPASMGAEGGALGRRIAVANGRVVHEREARRRRADWGGDSRGVKAAWGNEPTAAPIGGGGSGADHMRARRKIKPASNRAHASVDGCSEVGQGSSAIFSENVNCAQNFVNTRL